jgi:hypothetical protein
MGLLTVQIDRWLEIQLLTQSLKVPGFLYARDDAVADLVDVLREEIARITTLYTSRKV